MIDIITSKNNELSSGMTLYVEYGILYDNPHAYGLDGLGIEFRCGRDFPHLSRPAMGSTQPPVQWVPCLPRE